AVVLDRVVRADHHGRAGNVVLDRVVRHGPVVVGIGVDRSLAAGRREVLDRQVLDGDAGYTGPVPDEGESVPGVPGSTRVGTGDGGPRGADERVVAAGIDLGVRPAAQIVDARGKVIGRAGRELIGEHAGVIPGRDRDRAGRRRRRTGQEPVVAADG